MTVRRVFVIVFAIILLVLPVRPTLDPDMGWHLRTGEHILEHGLPHQDVFSFTLPGREWVTHEWLSEVLMALLHRAGGLATLILAFAGVVALTFSLVYMRCVGRPYLAAFITLLGALASALTWGVRPQMFNLLGLAAFVYVVEGVKDKKLDRRAFLFLPLLTVVWANLHSGYLLGVALLATYVVGEAIGRRFGPPDERGLDWVSIRLLAATAVLCFGTALLNPNGYRLWIYPFETLTSDAMQTYIQEWHSPDFHQRMYWPFAALLLGGAVSFIVSPRRPAWTDLLLFFGTAVAGLISARNIPIFAVAAIPIVARAALPGLADTRLSPLVEENRPSQQPSRLATAVNWLIVGLVGLSAIVYAGRIIRNNSAAMAATYPVEAVDFIERQGWEGHRVYNSYNWGGYLIWRGIPVFIDGRADLYGDEFILFYLQALKIKPDWREPLDEFAIDYVLIERAAPLSVALAETAEWQQAYSDDIAQIFTRVEAD